MPADPVASTRKHHQLERASPLTPARSLALVLESLCPPVKTKIGKSAPLRWPAPSIVQRSRPSRGVTVSAILPRGCRGPDCRGTDSLPAAVIERSASPNRQSPSAPPEIEAGKAIFKRGSRAGGKNSPKKTSYLGGGVGGEGKRQEAPRTNPPG